MNLNDWLVILIGIIAISSIIYLSHQNNKNVTAFNKYVLENPNNKCILYNQIEETYKINEVKISNGIYWVNTDFYCVWAKDRPLENIEKTDRHEYCHYLVDNDYNHFCEGVVKK